MPTAASAYRNRGLASAGRGPSLDPRDIIPNLHKKSPRSTADNKSTANSSIRKNTSSSKGGSRFPFLKKNSGGLAVSLLAVTAGTAAGNTTCSRRGSNGNSIPSVPNSSSRRGSFLFEEEPAAQENKLFFGDSLHKLLSSTASSVKTKAAALTTTSPTEKGAAFLASRRGRRSGSDDRTVSSIKSQSSHGGLRRSQHGLKVSLDMKRAAIQKSALSIKRSFTGTSLTMAETEEAASCVAASLAVSPLANFFHSFHHSIIEQLSTETPTNFEKSMAMKSKLNNGHPGRPVYNGHYVRVKPTPLKNPKLVIYSEEMGKELGLFLGGYTTSNTHKDVMNVMESEVFLKYFSGDLYGAVALMDDSEMKVDVESWATPYALSIMGRRYTNNCPYGAGDGYGDGRAISIGEVVIPKSPISDNTDISSLYPANASRYELQLKGAGQTPFCRGADGRAVLRSSIREFLASEAMHHLGISTTRALSLTVSDGPDGDMSMRPWYSSKGRKVNVPTMDDPRLAQYSDKEKREIISELAAQAKADPDTMIEERCAMTTRVASSFVRIGHLDLFSRRVEMMQAEMEEGVNLKETNEYQELEDMLWHACYREYYDEAFAPYFDKKDVMAAAIALMEGSMNRIANLVSGWVRVGFVQGNFNADNCLVGGVTMDYGPFGFLDVYHPLSAKWTGSGDHFGFMNQPKAGYANFAVLVESLLPLIDANGGNVDEIRDEMLVKARDIFSEAVDKVINSKMGVELAPPEMSKDMDTLWEEIEPLLRTARADWTLFWRQLTYVATEYSPTKCSFSDPGATIDYERMLSILLGDESTNPFYETLTDENRASLLDWLQKWHKALVCSHKHALTLPNSDSIPPPEERMRQANPKFILREWMLVDAYTKADAGKFLPGDYSIVHDLHKLSKDPYGEGSSDFHSKYYRRAPDESLSAGGTAFMS